jgi:hypothetical protein
MLSTKTRDVLDTRDRFSQVVQDFEAAAGTEKVGSIAWQVTLRPVARTCAVHAGPVPGTEEAARRCSAAIELVAVLSRISPRPGRTSCRGWASPAQSPSPFPSP